MRPAPTAMTAQRPPGARRGVVRARSRRVPRDILQQVQRHGLRVRLLPALCEVAVKYALIRVRKAKDLREDPAKDLEDGACHREMGVDGLINGCRLGNINTAVLRAGGGAEVAVGAAVGAGVSPGARVFVGAAVAAGAEVFVAAGPESSSSSSPQPTSARPAAPTPVAAAPPTNRRRESRLEVAFRSSSLFSRVR